MAERQITFEQFVNALPAERREAVRRVWQTVRQNIPAGYREDIAPSFLTYKAGEAGYVALANQKNYISLYLTPIRVYPELKEKLKAGGKQLRGGKSCINFNDAAELPLGTIGEIVGSRAADEFEEDYRRWLAECRAAG